MVGNQAYLFLIFTFTGMAIGILFDIFRALRKNFNTSDILISIQDILFWIITGFMILYNIWYFNDGEIRIFMFLGIILGVLIYILISSMIYCLPVVLIYILTLSSIIFQLLYKILTIAKSILIKPIQAIIKLFNGVFEGFLKILQKNLKKIGNKKGKIKKDGE